LSAYLVAAIDVHDGGTYAAYRDAVPALMAAHGGRYLVRGGTQTELEGAWPGRRTVVMEFPDRAAAEAFYRSPAYRDLLPIRQAAARGALIIVDGVEAL
jgi:uncharacterized protein (DUF1330 family)